jgi:hypothetical protein
MVDPKKLWPVFSKLEDRNDALQTIKNAALFFYVLAGAYTADVIKTERLMSTGYRFPPGTLTLMFVHMMAYAGGAFVLRRSNSRAIAFLLLSVSIFSATNMAVWISEGHSTAIVSADTVFQLLALWGSVRAVEATLKLHGRFAITNRTGS